MKWTGLHPGLEMRLMALATRIAKLRQKMGQAKGAEKVAAFGEIEELERRYMVLEGRLRALDREGPGLWPNLKAEVEKIGDDVTGTIEDLTIWIDSNYRPD